MPRHITVALAGNPNAGKTTLFNAITGARQHVGNWPGVTVEKKEGSRNHHGSDIHVVDLPGTYSLTAFSLEEIIARTFIVESSPDLVVDVVDASNLERNLYLTTQLLEMGTRVVMALNMIDVAEGRRIHIDVKTLSDLLGVPVIPTNGKRGVGIDQLLDAVVTGTAATTGPPRPRPFHYGTELEEELDKIEEILAKTKGSKNGLSHRWLAMKLLEGDPEVARMLEETTSSDSLARQVERSRKHVTDIFGDPPDIVLADARYGFISGAIKKSVRTEVTDRVHLSEAIDRVLTNRLLGPIILLAVLYVVYMFTFQASEPLLDYCDALFKWLGATASDLLPEGLLRSLIVSGVINGMGGVLRFTPLIAFMFLAIAILEDTGYMARIAFMLDRVLRGFGLHGASMLALMVSGGLAGGCAVPGIMATRTMKEPKERLVTILVAPLMNCGAKLPVYALLIGAFFQGQKADVMFLLTLISWGLALTAGKIIRSTVLSGPSAPFVLELPPYRIPTARGLLIHSWERTWMYVKKAGTVILAVSIVLWAMMTFPTLPEDRARHFDEKERQLTAAFLAEPGAAATIGSDKDREFIDALRSHLESGKVEELEKQYPAFFGEAKFQRGKQDAKDAKHEALSPALASLAGRYAQYESERAAIEAQRTTAHLKNSIGGRMGVALEWVFKPIGFDWRTNVALVGGFAAKEVVVSTLGTAYSLGEVDPKEAESLSERLQKEPGWNRLTAFTLIMFVMLYSPCFVTLVVIRRETGTWRWTFFAMAYTTALAYCVALVVHSAGTFLGLGLS